MTSNAVKTLQIMFDNEILIHFLPDSPNLDKLQFLIDLVNKHKIKQEVLRRLFILYTPDENWQKILLAA